MRTRSVECGGSAAFGGRCGFCFQRIEKGCDVENHKTATRLLMHKECSVQDLGLCSGCSCPLQAGVIAVNYEIRQRSCISCAVSKKWKCAPSLGKLNRLSSFFKKIDKKIS